jgi:aminopeptidase N
LKFLQSIDTIAIDAQNMNFTAVKLNGTAVPFINTGKQIQFVYPFCKGKIKLIWNTKQYPNKRCTLLGHSKQMICKYGHKAKDDIPAIGFRVLMM